MTARTIIGATLLLSAVAGCDAGPYDPAAHRQADAATGSLLSGVDAGAGSGGQVIDDPSIRGAGAGMASGGGR